LTGRRGDQGLYDPIATGGPDDRRDLEALAGVGVEMADPLARAWVRGLALINVADSHPLIVPRVRHYLTDVLKVSDEQRLVWIQHWLSAGMQAIEVLLAEHPSSGDFCHGDRPSIADICLVTQVTPAKTFNLSLDPYPKVMRIYDTCMAIPAFANAHPANQPDAE
jgi:maleylacetoacetate isomerase